MKQNSSQSRYALIPKILVFHLSEKIPKAFTLKIQLYSMKTRKKHFSFNFLGFFRESPLDYSKLFELEVTYFELDNMTKITITNSIRSQCLISLYDNVFLCHKAFQYQTFQFGKVHRTGM